MAELRPQPLSLLLCRLYHEREREGKVFDLPAREWYRGDAALDTSVAFHGRRAGTPAGPAAGPQDQLVQNIVLSWLGGGRIIELKTVQIMDRLKIPRPCIDATNVGYNVEWSQELRLSESLREYVAASMALEILADWDVLGRTPGAPRGAGAAGAPQGAAPAATPAPRLDTILDMSVGYDLAGIRSREVRGWIETMMDARALVDELRAEIPDEFAGYRDFPFRTRISDSITLSTFHGCPADEIERITEFLLREVGVHMTVKLNPTLLGKPAVDHLLHDILGYTEIEAPQEAFDKDLQFDQCLEIVGRLDRTARSLGRRLAVKFSNTLVVRNHKTFFPESERMMYLSGAPLHVLTMNLVKRFRDAVGHAVPISFSAGIDQHNFADAVALGFTPVTVCTDLLRPGGYGRFHKYVEGLEARMRSAGAASVGDFVLAAEGNGAEAVRRGPRVIPRGVFRVGRSTQWATFHDFCNECGNCDVFCPEDGGPFVEKPRVFSCDETYRAAAASDGYRIERAGGGWTIHGRIGGREYTLSVAAGALDAGGAREARDGPSEGGVVPATARFGDGVIDALVDFESAWPVSIDAAASAPVGHTLSLRPFLVLRTLLRGILDARRANYVNALAAPTRGGGA
jgi:putative selenate reductase